MLAESPNVSSLDAAYKAAALSLLLGVSKNQIERRLWKGLVASLLKLVYKCLRLLLL